MRVAYKRTRLNYAASAGHEEQIWQMAEARRGSGLVRAHANFVKTQAE